MMKTGHFADNYEPGKDFYWEGPYSQECFSDFLKLLENSRYIEEKRNPNLISLLEDWDCPEIIDDLISQVKSEFDHTIMHNGNQYQVNFRTFSTLSRYFCSQVQSSPDVVFSVSDEYSEETFSLFLDCLHGIKALPQDEKQMDLYHLCQNWMCKTLLGLINTQTPNFILPALTKGNLIDQKMVEENATQQIHTMIRYPLFYKLPLSTLSRVVTKSSILENIDNLLLFIENLLESHGIEAFFLIFSLDFSSCTEETILFILETLSKHSHSSLFQILVNQFCLKMEREKGLKEEKAEDQKRIEELNQQMKKEKTEGQQMIEELTKRLNEFENYQQEMERRKEEEERKLKEKHERIGKWKSTKAPDFEGNIFEAAAKGKLTSIIYLLANGTNVNVKYLRDKYPNESDGWSMKNTTPLHFAARYGHLLVVEYLVSKGTNIECKSDKVKI